jgi:hypothetical protein
MMPAIKPLGSATAGKPLGSATYQPQAPKINMTGTNTFNVAGQKPLGNVNYAAGAPTNVNIGGAGGGTFQIPNMQMANPNTFTPSPQNVAQAQTTTNLGSALSGQQPGGLTGPTPNAQALAHANTNARFNRPVGMPQGPNPQALTNANINASFNRPQPMQQVSPSAGSNTMPAPASPLGMNPQMLAQLLMQGNQNRPEVPGALGAANPAAMGMMGAPQMNAQAPGAGGPGGLGGPGAPFGNTDPGIPPGMPPVLAKMLQQKPELLAQFQQLFGQGGPQG